MNNDRFVYQSKIQTFFWKDVDFYSNNQKEIEKWAEDNGCKIPSKEFGWVDCPNEAVATLFYLKWG